MQHTKIYTLHVHVAYVIKLTVSTPFRKVSVQYMQYMYYTYIKM